jgi:hypothetical protein
MVISPEIQKFLNDVETFSAKKFRYRQEIEILVALSRERSMEEVFRDITFFSKFISNALNILKRTGADSAETEKLSVEFKDKLEKTSTLIKTLIKEAPGEVKAMFLSRFLSLSQESMNALLSLLYELSWIKNYSLEQERSA